MKPIPVLEHKHLQSCKVLPTRYDILDMMPKNSICTEVGVLYGDFSQEILRRVQPKEFYLIDLYRMYEDHYKDIFMGFNSDKNVFPLMGTSWEILSNFNDETFDFIYIDAGHNYEDVKRDAEIAMNKIKKDGYIIFNDYILYNNFTKIQKEPELFGVPYVIHELCLDYNFEFKYIALHPYMFCDVALKRIGE